MSLTLAYTFQESQLLQKNISLDSTSFSSKPELLDYKYPIDTFYGIKNETEIPIRTIKIQTTTAMKPEKLFDPSEKIVNVGNWQIILLVLAVMLLGFTKAFSNKRFKQTLKGLYNYGLALEVTREEKVFFHQSNLIFSIIHLVTSSLLLFQLNELFPIKGLEKSNFISFLTILGFISVMYLIKYVFAKILFFIFNDNSIVSEYIFNITIYNSLIGVALIPILLLIYFSSISIATILLYVTVPLLLLIFLFRLIRLHLIGITQGVSYIYIFVYICTLEILPLVVLFKTFMS